MCDEDARCAIGDEVSDGHSEGMVRILLTTILVEREKWVPMEGDLGRAKAKVLPLYSHIGLLKI